MRPVSVFANASAAECERLRDALRGRWRPAVRAMMVLLSYKRLALRYDRTAATITALARLAITFICAHRLPTN